MAWRRRALGGARVLGLGWLLAGLVSPAGAVTYTVTHLADPGTAGDSQCSLREAIESANGAGNGDCGPDSAGDDTIVFGLSGTITLGSTLPAIVSGQGSLTIDGGGAITISGGNSHRVLQVNSGADLTLRDLTVADGNANPGAGC